MPTAKKLRGKQSANSLKGAGFENFVRKVLDEGHQASGGRMTYQRKPVLKLQNGETVIPDFIVTTETPHEVRHFYIECQNRGRSTKDILHKIQHIRAKHLAKTFIYIYARKLGAELDRAFKSEGIVAHNLAGFRFFIHQTASFINYSLSEMQVVRTNEKSQTHSRLPPLQKVQTAFHSHPDAKAMIDDFLNRTDSTPPHKP